MISLETSGPQDLLFGSLKQGEVTDSTMIRKWKWLFMIGCEYGSFISAMTKFLNSLQDRTDTSLCSGIVPKNNDIGATYKTIVTFYLSFIT